MTTSDIVCIWLAWFAGLLVPPITLCMVAS